jgi:hypothetical protein
VQPRTLFAASAHGRLWHEPADPECPPHGRFRGDIVAKVAGALLWNSNLKETNRDVRTFESVLRVRVKT